jgi:hypothetical protein
LAQNPQMVWKPAIITSPQDPLGSQEGMKDIKYIVYNEQASLIMDNLCDLIELVYNFKVLFCDSIAYIYYHLLAITDRGL